MIIDFHTHVFPEQVAYKAIPHMAKISHTTPFLNGTLSELKASMKASGVTCSIVLPVVTKPNQFDSINAFALSNTEKNPDRLDGSVIFFGGIHPNTSDYKKELNALKSMGMKGIKLHPDYQNMFFDDIRYMRIVDYASQLDLIISVHAGIDAGLPTPIHCTPDHIVRVVKEVRPHKLVLAHTGGWEMWDEVEKKLVGLDLYMDTSNTLTYIDPKQFLRIVRNHGVDRILFATDSPWEGQAEDLGLIKKLGLTEKELNLILGENAAKLLNLPEQLNS